MAPRDVLAELGWRVHELPCDADGRTRPAAIDDLPGDVTVVSLMLANNESGVIQPVAELAERAHLRGLLVHCDAVQAAGKIPIDSGHPRRRLPRDLGTQVRRSQG